MKKNILSSSLFVPQFDQITVDANQYSNKLQSTNSEIAELKRLISRLQQEINAAVAQVRGRTKAA